MHSCPGLQKQALRPDWTKSSCLAVSLHKAVLSHALQWALAEGHPGALEGMLVS